MKKFQVCWAYEQLFSTILEGNSEEEAQQKFLDGEFDGCEVEEHDGRIVDGSLEVLAIDG